MISHEFRLSSTDLRATLKRRLETWRASERHPLLTANNYLRCKSGGHGGILWLQLEPQGRGPQIRWHGKLTTISDTQTRLDAHWRLTNGTWIEVGCLAILATALRLFPWSQSRLQSPDAFAIFWFLGMFSFLLAVAGWRAARQEAVITDLLRGLLQLPEPVEPDVRA